MYISIHYTLVPKIALLDPNKHWLLRRQRHKVASSSFFTSSAVQTWMEVLWVLDCIRSIARLVMTAPLAPSSPIWQLIVMAGDMLICCMDGSFGKAMEGVHCRHRRGRRMLSRTLQKRSLMPGNWTNLSWKRRQEERCRWCQWFRPNSTFSASTGLQPFTFCTEETKRSSLTCSERRWVYHEV